ncbi:two-component system sensor histidine kinase DcuS, partial [Staphylococcus arlettae]
LIGKLSLAREQNITLTIINKTVIPEPQHSYLTHEIITIVGNLIDNSMDSLTTASTKSIDVQLKYDLEHLYIDVIDSGKGL